MIVFILCAMKSNFIVEKSMKSQYTFFCFIMTVHQDHVLRKKGKSCDACRSFAFPVMLDERLDKTLLSAERQKTMIFFANRMLTSYTIGNVVCFL